MAIQRMKIWAAAAVLTVAWGAAAQTATTGELTGTVSDAGGGLVAGATVTLTNTKTNETRSVTSNESGAYTLPLLVPGTYSMRVVKEGFKTDTKTAVQVNVTEVDALNVTLEVGQVSETVEVTTEATLIQTATAALGNTIGSAQIENLPLVTRNYTQILGLSAGVQMPVTNAAEVGRGSGSSTGGSNSLTSGAKITHGNRQYDNNFEINGVTVNDTQGNGVLGGVDVTGGVPTPNPDSIEEFKVQTAQYDATFGRNAGAQINVVTKGGTSQFHGSLWEYFRNEDLNANDWFRKLAGQPRGRLRQNQYGGTLSGPVVPSHLLFFGSYQGTKQSNGVAAQCSSSVFGPAQLTNDRSAATLGAEFAGQAGAQGGTAVLASGANINPVALKLLQYTLPNGQYLIPTPQTTVGGLGFSSFSVPCAFSDNQFVANADYLQGSRNVLQGRFFFDNGNQTTSFPSGNVPGFTQSIASRYRVGSATDTFTISPRMVNELTFGINASDVKSPGYSPLSYNDLGVVSPLQGSRFLRISITGTYSLASGFDTASNRQLAFNLTDSLSYTRGAHALRSGGGFIRQFNTPSGVGVPNGLTFLSFPDFLLGLPGGAAGNGTAFSNVYTSTSLSGLSARQYRQWGFNGYAQDDWKITRQLTLNLGFRYEFVGSFADALGRNAAFVLNQMNQTPPSAGTLAGLVVASNFPGGAAALPAGVALGSNELASYGGHPNTFAPRIGFALAEASNMVLRGGYGIFYSTPTLQNFFQTSQGQPWQQSYTATATANVNASFANPYPGVNLNPTFPFFQPYSPTTALSNPTQDPNVRPALVQTVSLNQQVQFTPNTALELGYVGSHGQHLLNVRYINAAGFATAANPIRGNTANSTSNIPTRVPFEGFSPTGFYQVQSEAENWYSGLEATLRKRLSRHTQGLVAYTWSKDIDTEGPGTSGASSAAAPPGNPYQPRHDRGLPDFDRRHRFIASYLYELPRMRSDNLLEHLLVNGWRLAGVTTIQTGTALTPVTTNARNYAGVTNDLAQVSGTCPAGQVTTGGGVNTRVTRYFNTACFSAAPTVDGSGATAVTGYGNSGIGTARGPDQDDTDLSLIKQTAVNFPRDGASVELRTDFFNVLNLPQFANPGTNVSTTSTFGRITSTSVSARVIQFALRYSF